MVHIDSEGSLLAISGDCIELAADAGVVIQHGIMQLPNGELPLEISEYIELLMTMLIMSADSDFVKEEIMLGCLLACKTPLTEEGGTTS